MRALGDWYYFLLAIYLLPEQLASFHDFGGAPRLCFGKLRNGGFASESFGKPFTLLSAWASALRQHERIQVPSPSTLLEVLIKTWVKLKPKLRTWRTMSKAIRCFVSFFFARNTNAFLWTHLLNNDSARTESGEGSKTSWHFYLVIAVELCAAL